MDLVGAMRLLSPGLALVGPRWERRNWLGLKRYVESDRRSASAGDERARRPEG
jgi:hypothetical protein